jgi:hypothetical protein
VPASPDLLVDTSAWIEVFRRRPRITIEQLVGDLDRVVTCLPVIQEVLQGFDDERAFRVAHEAMWALPRRLPDCRLRVAAPPAGRPPRPGLPGVGVGDAVRGGRHLVTVGVMTPRS